MKKLLGILTVSSVLLFAGGQSVQAKTLFGDYLKDAGINVEMSGSLDYYSKYVWRGTYLDQDSVLQPGVAFAVETSIGTFDGGFWGSYDVENEDGLASDEQDWWIGYTVGLASIGSLSIGHTWYEFPEGNTSSKEIYVSLAIDTFLSPTISWYHDYEDGKDFGAATGHDAGNYFAFDFSHSFTLSEDYGITLDLASTFGYVQEQWLAGSGWHITPTIGLTIPATETLTISPFIGYNAAVSGELDDANDNEVFGGISMAYTF